MAGILETIPLDISFGDVNDMVRFWNKLKNRVFSHLFAINTRAIYNIS